MAWKMSQKIWLIFLRAVESLKICTLMGSFCAKHIKFLLKKYRRFMSHDNEEWRKVWRKTDSWWILLQATASLKIWLWCATFVESISCLSQKSTEELCDMTLKKDAKFEQWLALWKMTLEIWQVLTQHSKVSKFTL